MNRSIFIAALKDFFTFKFLSLTFAPFVITFLLLSFIFWGAGGSIVDILTQLAQNPEAINNPEIAKFVQEHPWIASIVGSTVFKILFGTIVAVLGTLLAILLSTALATVIMGFFTSTVVKEIHKRHYQTVLLEGGISVFGYLSLMAKVLIRVVGIFILAGVLYFIPLVNVIALNIPFYYLFHSFLTLDVGGEIFDKKELEEVLNSHKFKIMSTTLILYLITLIPLAGMVLQVYFVSVMAHLFFRLKAQ